MTYKWFDIPEKGIQMTKLIHQGKTYSEIKSLLKKGEEIASYQLLQDLRNDDKYRDLLGLNDTWAFVPNPDKISEKNGYVAWFFADSDRALLDCYGNPALADASLGVFFVRRGRFKEKA
jgi:hypothetical protein